MRKNLILLIAGILLLATAGVAQAQEPSVYQVVGSAVTAREGGGAEATGSVVLSRIAGPMDGTNTGTVTVQYSAPVSEGQTDFDVIPANAGIVVAINDDGLTTITLAGTSPVIILRGIRVDVREVTGEVTAAVSGDGTNAIVAGTVTVISSIVAALDVSTGDATSVLTRGTVDKSGEGAAETAAEAWVTIKEGFAAAFTSDVGLTLKIEGLPKNAKLNIFALGKGAEDAVNTAGIRGNVNIADKKAVIMGDAMTTETEVYTMTGDGKDMFVDITFNPGEAAPSEDNSPSNSRKETLTLTLALDANMGTGAGADDASVALPLMGEIRASVTMMPVKAESPADGTPYFTENFMPAGGGAVFTFAPASCTLLFPYAAFSMGWDTGIAIANPSDKAGGTPLSGSLTFTLFPNDEDMVEYSTDGMSPGLGLDPDGFLPAGNTYIVLLNEILDSAGFSGDFLGHIYVDTDFTGCRGLGYVSDFNSGAQAYLPYFGDNLDEGSVPANK